MLARAYTDGQLDHEEFDERYSVCFAARYIDELVALVADLAVGQFSPADLVPPGAQLPAVSAEPHSIRTISVMGRTSTSARRPHG